MLNFSLTIHKLFFMHEWEEIDSQRNTFFTRGYTLPTRQEQIYTLRCKACGTLKRKKIKL